MSMLGTKQPTKYEDGRTKQSFKDLTDVNAIIDRHTRAGTLSHLEKFQGQYGDLADFDFVESQNQIAKANTMFERLPAKTRLQFNNDPQKFFEFVNDPENRDDLAKKLPELASSQKRRELQRAAAEPQEPADPPKKQDPAEPEET